MKKPIDFEAEANIGPSAEQLREIGALAHRQCRLEREIADVETRLAALARDLRQVQEVDLPEAMLSAGCSAYTLDTGESVKVENGLSANLSAEKKPAACAWLRANGYGDIVSDDVLARFSRGHEDEAKRIVELLQANNIVPTITTNVNTATLKALIRENMSKGIDMPLDTLGAYTWRKAKIKTP